MTPAQHTDSKHNMSGFRFILLTYVKEKSFVKSISGFNSIQRIMKVLIKTYQMLHNNCGMCGMIC